ncbi:MAG: hypothetical protein U9R15_00055 [Chloroflexota bacterium]|nr:hypothetical protein [Chloroflexota bacterium]
MVRLATVEGLCLPTASRVTVKIEISADVNISVFVAQQKANHFLVMRAGDQLCAYKPELVVGPTLRWRVPVQYAPSRKGPLGIVGHLLIDAETGEVTIADGQTSGDLLTRAEALYERATL